VSFFFFLTDVLFPPGPFIVPKFSGTPLPIENPVGFFYKAVLLFFSPFFLTRLLFLVLSLFSFSSQISGYSLCESAVIAWAFLKFTFFDWMLFSALLAPPFFFAGRATYPPFFDSVFFNSRHSLSPVGALYQYLSLDMLLLLALANCCDPVFPPSLLA